MKSRDKRHRARQRRRGLAAPAVAGMALAALASSACSAGHHPDTAATTTGPTTSTTALAQLEATIISRWRAAQEASGAVAMDPTSAGLMLRLSDYFLDPELGFLNTQYSRYASDGLKTVGRLDLGSPKVVSITATQAIVESCETDALAVVHANTGNPLPGPAGNATPTPAGVRATLVMAPSGLWDVSDTSGTEGSCAGY